MRICGIVAIALAAPAFSQGLAADTDAGTLEEIIVTAQKREQNLQRTPISIAAYTSEQLRQSHIEDLYDIGAQTPGMIVNKEIVGKIYVRGIGAENLTIGGDPGVAVHTDGAYVARTSAAILDLFDVERVEVLRGPQGTLYGRNATGGSVNIISKAPTNELEANVSGEFGNYDHARLGAVLSGPIVPDKIQARAAVVRSERDGYVRNVLTGGRLDDQDLLMGRLRLRLLPTDSVTIDLIADAVEDDSSPAPFKQLQFSNLFEGALGAFDPPGLRQVAQESRVSQRQDQWGVTGVIRWDLPGYSLTSVSSYRHTEFDAEFDGDAVDITFQNFADFDDTRQYTQELRLASEGWDRWQWIAGVYYFNDDGATTISIPIPGLRFDILHHAQIATDAYAAFGQATYDFTDRFSATLGLRYNSEDKQARQFSDFGFIPPLTQDLRTRSDAMTPKLGIEYQPGEDVLLFASATRGFKSGGFTFNGFQPGFDPEYVWSYEAGVKSRLRGGAMLLNGSAFYYDYTDLQVSKLQNNAGVITNAADATIYGAEIELIAVPLERWRVNVGLSALDAQFDRFLTEDPSNPQLGTIDLAGNRLPRSPRFTGNLGTQYAFALAASGDLTLRLDYQYQSKSYFTPFNRDLSAQQSFGLLNARLGYQPADRKWEIAAYVHNARNEDYFINILESGVETGKPEGFVAPPRTYGLQFSYALR